MRRLLSLLCLLSVPALAAQTKKIAGEGFQLESTSPVLPLIKFRGPEGAEVGLWDKPGSIVTKGSCKVPCEITPGSDWSQVAWTVKIKGALWAKGVINIEHRTGYVVTIDDPNGLPEETASAPAPSKPVPSAPAPSAPAPAPVVTAPAPSKSMGMDDSSFQRLRGAIAKERIASSKMSVLKLGVRDAKLTVAQVGTLVDLFTYAEDKVDVVRLTRAGLVDPDNGFELFQHFTYASDKEKVQALLEGDSEEGGDTSMRNGMPSMPSMPKPPEPPGGPDDYQ
jgi:hypothetical protein